MKTPSPAVLEWSFPLPEAGCGVLMGNGTQGLMVWGVDKVSITVGRNGFWDRRESGSLRPEATFARLKECLDAGDAAGAAKLCLRAKPPAAYRKPTQLPCARIDLSMPGWVPARAVLQLASGTLVIEMSGEDGRLASLVIGQSRDRERAWIECDPKLGALAVTVVPMWNYLGETLARDGVLPPTRWDGPEEGGCCQTLPEDDALALAWRWHGRLLVLATALGDDPSGRAKAAARDGVSGDRQHAAAWWHAYWSAVPHLSLPDGELQHAYLHGLHLQAGLTPPEGGAATLVGPWMEENLLPCWSNDYHLNINAQMIYWPCLATNRAAHLRPLWDKIGSWLPQLRRNGETFFGVPDTLILPHAVTDQGKTVDDFWTGMIDHGCTAWMAQLAWLHYRHEMDGKILREVAWPLLRGAFNGYWAMLEESRVDGRPRLALPLTVSPEYSASGRGWGANASFQLAAFHMLAAILPRAASVLGEAEDPRWKRVREEVPPYATTERPDIWDAGKTVDHIALWEGQELAESHRHHSHLAAIYPFASIDPFASEHREVVRASLQQWIGKGAGWWVGWSLPWAASLCARCDLGDAAVNWLHWWRNIYNNLGHGSDINGDFAGCTIVARDYLLPDDPPRRYRPAIQLDAAMGTVTAILELLVRSSGDLIAVLPSLPKKWKSLRFDGIRTEGAFLVGATVEGGRTVEVRVTSLHGGPLRLRHGMGPFWKRGEKPEQGELLETSTRPGERLVLTRI